MRVIHGPRRWWRAWPCPLHRVPTNHATLENTQRRRECFDRFDVHIGRNVTIGANSNIQGSNYIADKTIIGNSVFIGPNSTILNDKYPPSGDATKWIPVHIHDHAVIGGDALCYRRSHWRRSSARGGSVLTKPLRMVKYGLEILHNFL